MQASEVLEDRTGSDANPALLCYVRKDKNLVDTLHREMFELEVIRRQQEQENEMKSEPEVSTKAEPNATGPERIVEVKMEDKGDQNSKQPAESNDVDMAEPDKIDSVSEKPLIDLNDSAAPMRVKVITEKEKEDDDLMT